MYFDAVNAAGGVHGRKISCTTLDDGFDPKRAVDNTRKLIPEDGVFLIELPSLQRARQLRQRSTAHTVATQAGRLVARRRDLRQQARGIILAQIVPSLRNTTIPVVAKYAAQSHNGSSCVELAIIDYAGQLRSPALFPWRTVVPPCCSRIPLTTVILRFVRMILKLEILLKILPILNCPVRNIGDIAKLAAAAPVADRVLVF